MFVGVNDDVGYSYILIVNLIYLELEKVLACKIISRTSSEMRAILIQSISQDSCTERATLTVIGWFFLFGFLMHPMRWCWL